MLKHYSLRTFHIRYTILPLTTLSFRHFVEYFKILVSFFWNFTIVKNIFDLIFIDANLIRNTIRDPKIKETYQYLGSTFKIKCTKWSIAGAYSVQILYNVCLYFSKTNIHWIIAFFFYFEILQADFLLISCTVLNQN